MASTRAPTYDTVEEIRRAATDYATGPFPIQHAFVVQFAADTRLDATGITGRVEHLVSGQAIVFRSVEALFTFMAARLQEVQQLSTAEDAAESRLHD